MAERSGPHRNPIEMRSLSRHRANPPRQFVSETHDHKPDAPRRARAKVVVRVKRPIQAPAKKKRVLKRAGLKTFRGVLCLGCKGTTYRLKDKACVTCSALKKGPPRKAPQHSKEKTMNIHAPVPSGAPPIAPEANGLSYALRPEPISDDARLSMRTNSGGCQFIVAIKKNMLRHLDDPARLEVFGTVQEGLKVSIPDHPKDGLKVTYDVAGDWVYLSGGYANRGVTKKARSGVSVKAQIVDGSIKVSGPPQQWIDADSFYVPKERAPKQMPVTHVRLPANPASGGFKAADASIDAPSTAPVMEPAKTTQALDLATSPAISAPALTGETRVVQDKLKEYLGHVRILKNHLETTTGMKFRIDGNCQLVAVL